MVLEKLVVLDFGGGNVSQLCQPQHLALIEGCMTTFGVGKKSRLRAINVQLPEVTIDMVVGLHTVVFLSQAEGSLNLLGGGGMDV
jgi:hypothetical protein